MKYFISNERNIYYFLIQNNKITKRDLKSSPMFLVLECSVKQKIYFLLIETQDTLEKTFDIKRTISMAVNPAAGTILGVGSLEDCGTTYLGTHALSCCLFHSLSSGHTGVLWLGF